MNNSLFDRAMLCKLLAMFSSIGSVTAVLPIPRFEADFKGIKLESPIQRETAVKLLTVDAQ